MYIDVLVELKTQKIDKTFTYLVPNNLIHEIKIGKRVLVPFGNGSKKRIGIVFSVSEFIFLLTVLINSIILFAILYPGAAFAPIMNTVGKKCIGSSFFNFR